MKKFLSALLAAVLLLSATACAAHEPVLPPSRWGEGEAQGMLPRTYSLSEAYDAAEVVALVTVGDWLEEELITGRTFFRTTVQKVYKGDIPHEFVLAQEGCSTWTYRNYPVFTYGNQLLLFLIKYDVSMYRDTYDLVEYPDAYELISTYSTVMYVTQDDSGMSYVLDALGVMTEWSQINQPADCPAVAHPGQEQLLQIRDNLTKQDPVLAAIAPSPADPDRLGVSSGDLYRLTDLEDYFAHLSADYT